MVAEIVGLEDRAEIADAAVGAERPDGLVFGTLAAGAGGGRTPRATDGTALTGGAMLGEASSQHLARDRLGILELSLAKVARR